MTQSLLYPQVIPLSGAYNIRDLGGYRTHGGTATRFRRILRADAPHRLTGQDIDTLLDLGLKTVIDLRAPHEVLDAPSPLSTLHGLDYCNLPLFDALSPDHLQAPAHVLDPVLNFYFSTLAARKTHIAEIFRTMAQSEPGVVMFNCTAGKDRTGLISALLLGNADVRAEDIVSDYAMTEPLISGLVDEFIALARNSGRDLDAYRRVLRARPETMTAVLAEITARHGSIRAYLADIGIGQTVRANLADRLLI